MFMVSVLDCSGGAASLTLYLVHLALGLVLKTVMMRGVLRRLALFVLFLYRIRGPRCRIMHLINLALRFVLEFVMLLFRNNRIGSGGHMSIGLDCRNTGCVGGDRQAPE